MTLGTGAVLLGALWAHRYAVPGARDLAGQAADVLLAEAEERPTGLDWRFVPHRFQVVAGRNTPNFSHGLAGIAAALAVAGITLDRPDLVEAARRGADHLVTLADTSDGGFVVPREVPTGEGRDYDPVTFTWCHGPTGTSLLFLALDHAGVDDVAGDRACWRFVEHRNPEPLLPPGVGWMQGTAGIAAFLFRCARVGRMGRAAEAVARMDTWWALDGR